jgi:hypothetical protein
VNENMSENKFKVKEVLKDVFPELVKDLQEHGQRVPVFVTKDGIIKDGIKRTLLAENPSELKVEIVDDDAFVENIPLTRKQRNIVIKFAYDNFIKTGRYIHKEAVEKLSKRYGLSTRQIENIIYGHEKISLPSNKPRKSRCDTCQYKNETFELKNKINELNSELMKLKSQSKEQLKEEITNSQYEVEQIIALFLKKHPNKGFTRDGRILDNLNS